MARLKYLREKMRGIGRMGRVLGTWNWINTRKAMKDDSIAILFYEVISNFRMN
jgi:hypothetical protein